MTDLAIENISVLYADNVKGTASTPALDNINLRIKAGEFIVVLGASGCGKTTLLNVIAGFVRPSRGQVAKIVRQQDGRESRSILSGPGADRGVVFQKHALLPWLNVLDNVAFGLKLQGVGKSEREQIAHQCLVQVGLEGQERRAVYQLSGGMQQRVGIARALATDPELLLLDEPLGALDAFTRESLQELLLRLWYNRDKKQLLITHCVEEALFLASRLIIMAPNPGRISHQFELSFNREFLACGDARQIKSSSAFIEMRETVLKLIQSSQQTEGTL